MKLMRSSLEVLKTIKWKICIHRCERKHGRNGGCAGDISTANLEKQPNDTSKAFRQSAIKNLSLGTLVS